MYGSSYIIEREVLERLQSIGAEAAHPLLLPGIIAELELSRHTRLVDASVSEVEAKILELDLRSKIARDYSSSEIERRNQSKRTSWLDLTYLRNSLTTWSVQLLKMAEHAEALQQNEFNAGKLKKTRHQLVDSCLMGLAHGGYEMRFEHISNLIDEKDSAKTLAIEDSVHLEEHECFTYVMDAALEQSSDVGTSDSDDSQLTVTPTDDDEHIYLERMRRVGEKIKARITTIRDEYDGKIRECTMRVDGMAMATQWVPSPIHVL